MKNTASVCQLLLISSRQHRFTTASELVDDIACDGKSLIRQPSLGGRLCAQDDVLSTFLLYRLHTGTQTSLMLHAMPIVVTKSASEHD